MPPRRLCPKPGCNNYQPCPTHVPLDNARRNKRVRDYGYSSANWQRVRRERHALAGGQCELRRDGCTHRATHTHLDPRMNGRHDLATLNDCQACCSSCSGAIDAPRSQPHPTGAIA